MTVCTPYYDDGTVTIYHGDARDARSFLNQSIDLLLTDPPYEIAARRLDQGVLAL